VLAAALLVAAVLTAGCGGDSDEGETTLPTSLQAPGTEDELAFCLGRLTDPALDDEGRFDLTAECTGLDRDAVEAHPAFVACLSGVARDAPHDRVQERVDRCLVLFGDA
jgi:hypothetical protein